MNIDALYQSRGIENFEQAVNGMRELDIKGCAVSMPFKMEALKYMDSLDPGARDLGAVNTIIQRNRYLTGYNTDILAVEKTIEAAGLESSDPVTVLGAGGMARAVLGAFRRRHFDSVEVMARNTEKGETLAREFGARLQPWGKWTGKKRVVVNATSLGFKDFSSRLDANLEAALTHTAEVWDVVADPAETVWIGAAKRRGLSAVAGTRFQMLQALEQFVLYTGQHPSDTLASQAFQFAVTALPLTETENKLDC